MKRIIMNLKMAKKMMLLPAIILIFVLLLSFAAYRGMAAQKTAIDDIFNKRFKTYHDTAELVEMLANIHTNVYKLISWLSANYEEQQINALANEQKKALEKTVEIVQTILKRDTLTVEERKLFERLQSDLMEYRKPVEGVISVATSDVNVATMFMGTSDDKYRLLSKTLRELNALEEKLSQEAYDAALVTFKTVLSTFGVILVVVIVLSLILNVFITRMVTGPIKETIEVIRRVADGDLTQEIRMDAKDEIGELVSSINVMREKMGQAVGRSRNISQILSESASRQASAIEETSASLDEIASMTKRNADNTSEANNFMTAVKEMVEKANKSMADLTKSMKEIATASEQTQKIVKSIDEIAFQTNLLALNAAVEAARAGDAGAGFAVVAGEVRNLAMRATESAKNTAELIADIVKKVKGGGALVTATNELFTEVTASSAKVVELMGEVTLASQEQSEGMDQVNRAMAEITHVTQQTAANADELASVMAMFKVAYDYSRALDAVEGKRALPEK